MKQRVNPCFVPYAGGHFSSQGVGWGNGVEEVSWKDDLMNAGPHQVSVKKIMTGGNLGESRGFSMERISK
jgi:hypothetical protein